MKSVLFLLFFSITSFAKYEAHEWGTFTSLIGSNGITQEGMYHEDEVLPDFVHPFGDIQLTQLPPVPQPFPEPPEPPVNCHPHSKACLPLGFLQANKLTQKMETPVIYFYSESSKQQRVDVNVKFPEGIVTETYPAPVKTFPTRDNIQSIGNGDTTFSVDVLPVKTGEIKSVSSDNIYSHARNVNSNLVKANDELEKFIFYRGVGRYQPELKIIDKGGSLYFMSSQNSPQAVFLVDVDKYGHNQLIKLSEFSMNGNKEVTPDQIAKLQNHQVKNPDILSGSQSRQALITSLVNAKLTTEEATAMIDTWESGYLKVPGLRVLYILDRKEVDKVLPITFTPAPEKLERVFVGRIEVLMEADESRILNEILLKKAYFKVESLGRFAEAILNRVQQVYIQKQELNLQKVDPSVLELFKNLIGISSKETFTSTSTI